MWLLASADRAAGVDQRSQCHRGTRIHPEDGDGDQRESYRKQARIPDGLYSLESTQERGGGGQGTGQGPQGEDGGVDRGQPAPAEPITKRHAVSNNAARASV